MESANYNREHFQSNEQLQLAEEYALYTNQHVFLTGKAGTGKTTFLHRLKTLLQKRMIVVAPTGVAAMNAGGVTMHSFFQLPFHPFIPFGEGSSNSAESNKQRKAKKFSIEKRNIIKSLDLIIIDEVSMVRADLLDAVDEVLRRFKDPYQPFGGAQLLMIGDVHQLAPVVKDEDWNVLRAYYQTPFFFGSRALAKAGFVSIELTKVFRQKDERFIALLNKIRDNQADTSTFAELNKRHIPNFKPSENDGYVTLCTHNYQANAINQQKMKLLNRPKHEFKAEIDGIFPEHIYPIDRNLELKVDAQVMFVKNDSSGANLFFNGKTDES